MNAALDTAGPAWASGHQLQRRLEYVSRCRSCNGGQTVGTVGGGWLVGDGWCNRKRSTVHISASAFMICPDLSTQMCCQSCQWHSGSCYISAFACSPNANTSTLVCVAPPPLPHIICSGAAACKSTFPLPALWLDNCAEYASAWLQPHKEPMKLASQHATMSRVQHQMAAAIGLRTRKRRSGGATSPFGTDVSPN